MQEMWRCSAMMDALKKHANPCANLVRSQFEQGGIRLKSEFHLPEPWTGVDPEDLPTVSGRKRVPILFLSASAPFRAGEANVPRLTHDMLAYHSFYTRRFASRTGVFQLPSPGESIVTFGGVELRASERQESPVLLYYEPVAGASDSRVVDLLWTGCAAVLDRIMDASTLRACGYEEERAILGKHAVIMPLVHCKSLNGVGVREAAARCGKVHTARILAQFDPRLIVALGSETLEGLARCGMLTRESLEFLVNPADAAVPVAFVSLKEGVELPMIFLPDTPSAPEGDPSLDIPVPSSQERLRALRDLMLLNVVNTPLCREA